MGRVKARERLTEGLEAALAALEAHGISRTAVVLGMYVPGSNWFETHVGNVSKQEDPNDAAAFLSIIARDLTREVQLQAQALVRDESCPACGSPRWAIRQARRKSRPDERPGVYMDVWDECMDCGHKSEER